MPVRLGQPQGVSGLTDVVRNPIYATAVGLLLYAHKHEQDQRSARSSGGAVDWIERLKRFFQGNF